MRNFKKWNKVMYELRFEENKQPGIQLFKKIASQADGTSSAKS